MNKKTLFLIISVLIISIACVAVVLNSHLDRIADGFGILDLDTYYQSANRPAGGDAEGNPSTGGPGSNGTDISNSGGGHDLTNPLTSEQERIAAEIEARLNRPVDRKDLLKAGIILVSSLSREELNYVYEVGRKTKPSKEEMMRVKEILLNNLSAEDIATLRELGGNYGKSLKILDPDVPIQ